MTYGTYTTIDCPTEKIEEAQKFLEEQFDKIGGKVRKIMNGHDFGSYPSFEIDYPIHLEEVDEDCECTAEESLCEEKNDWITEANVIETAYYSKFNKYL